MSELPERQPRTLGELINIQIMSQGPMSLSTYMNLCLTHPTLGYYRKADPLGETGDFITAPEISQMFGEMIGIWVAQVWQQLGSPTKFTLAELGPGRGTLMADCLRVLQSVPGILDAAEIFLVETNPVLIEKQRELLAEYKINWRSEIEEFKNDEGPLVVITNEFFDALPIKQFQFSEGKWHERCVGLKDGQRVWGLSPTPLPADAIPAHAANAKDNEVIENVFVAQQVTSEIADIIVERSGALLAIDYGYGESQTGETLQALKAHKSVDPLAEPGSADLTTHVDFGALADVALKKSCMSGRMMTQAEFLKSMGIEPRAQNLSAGTPRAAEKINADLHRLISDDEMGNLFKAWCMYSASTPPYPFEAM